MLHFVCSVFYFVLCLAVVHLSLSSLFPHLALFRIQLLSSYAAVGADSLPATSTSWPHANWSVDRVLASTSVRWRFLRLSSTCFTQVFSLAHGSVLSFLVVVGAKVVCMAVEQCPLDTPAQTTVSVFSVSPLHLWNGCHIVDIQFYFGAGQAGIHQRFAWRIEFERSPITHCATELVFFNCRFLALAANIFPPFLTKRSNPHLLTPCYVMSSCNEFKNTQ